MCLARDRRGNTLAMMAIALIPLTALGGSAIDTGRVMFVKTRLQQACDAGALAGRKFMKGSEFDQRAQTQANAFFANNFQAGMMGSGTPSFVAVRTADFQVAGTASVTVPMTLTQMIGMKPVALTVTCEAKLEVPNLDVMFVLDTTGSMAETNRGDLVNKITALRTAVVNFYDTMDRARQPGTDIRYGAVPYSANVNVGMLLRPDWIADRWHYQSRIADGTTESERTTTDTNDYVYTYGAWTDAGGSRTSSTTAGAAENCVAPASTSTVSTDDPAWSGGNPQTRTVTQVRNGTVYGTSQSGGCTITRDDYVDYRRTRTESRRPNPNKGRQTTVPVTTYWWRYRPVDYDLTVLKGSGTTVSGGSFTTNIANNHQPRRIEWSTDNACIEERRTVQQSLFPSIPIEARDMDIDLVPTPGDPDTQWKPALPKLIYDRTGLNGWTIDAVRASQNVTATGDRGGDVAVCPSPAMRLRPISRDELKTYVDNMRVGGFTYHDVGFLWGARLLSPTGIFGADNQRAANGGEISRHIIFMTDGQTSTRRENYDAYGISTIDRRRTLGLPTDAEQNAITEQRLTALCQSARNKGMTVWVIAFGTSLTQTLRTCSSGGRAFQAANADQLNTAFANIAAQIAKLRVSK
ncbi:TadE/TadG family type IV pilus assembly protein [Sphingomonas sp. VNH70]|uniref:pilus assembly protein n=1 Tax=Sphingomonas silueang TaxID=3156617 RepID=UPI0032B32C66